MTGLRVFCADIGSVSAGKFGWAVADTEGHARESGSDIRELARSVASHLNSGAPASLGFECPLFVPLRDELSYVEAYLALEKARLDERLNVEWVVPPEAVLDHPVPTLILQPIVENAVVHGIARKPEGGTVRITIEEADGGLLLRVEDDGAGIESARLSEILDPGQASSAIGLRNIDGRLRALYGEDYRLAVESEVEGGTSVQIKIPTTGY